MGVTMFCRSKSLSGSIICLPLLLAVSLLATPAAFSQTKPERQSKAAKSAESTPSKTATSDDQSSSESQPSNTEDKPFRGMKYRLIGPFRGGRSLTAAGIPGDPTTYYFGATGGGRG